MNSEQAQPDPELLLQVVNMKMPFGKYKDTILCDLPISYLEWFQRKGFPKGKLGTLLGTIYEIKMNGLSYLLDPLKGQHKQTKYLEFLQVFLILSLLNKLPLIKLVF